MFRSRLIAAAAFGILGLALGAFLLYRMLDRSPTTAALPPAPAAAPATARAPAPSASVAGGPAAAPAPETIVETPEEAQKVLTDRLLTLGSSCGDAGPDERAIRVPRSSSLTVTVLGGTADDRGRIQHELDAFVRGDHCLRIAPIKVWSDRAPPAYLRGADASRALADRKGLEVVAFVDAGATESVYLYDHDIRRALGEVITVTRFAKTPATSP